MKEPVFFEGLERPCFFEQVAFRKPRKGEYYLSGAFVAAYQAKADLDSKYHVVRPTYYAKRESVWLKGEKV